MPHRDYTDVDHDSTKLREVPFQPSTIETIDYAIFDYLDNSLDLRAVTNKGWNKVPIIWTSTERVFQIKHDKGLRDNEGALILPIITIERSAFVKDLNRKGSFQANIPFFNAVKGGSVVVGRRIKQDKTSEFANADQNRRYGRDRVETGFVRAKKNKKIVYETIMMPQPVYVNITYSIILRTEYQMQMNQLLQPFMTRPGGITSIILKKDGHSYEAFVDGNISLNNNITSMDQEERKYETKININVLGYLMGEDTNDNRPKYSVYESAAEYRFPREHVMMEDQIEHGGGSSGNIRAGGANKNAPDDGNYRE